jgi:hypothetical protein
MATITFHANIVSAAHDDDPTLINHGAGSGLGFFGNGFGISVPVGQYQDSTWVTNANGTSSDHYQLNNTKFTSESGVSYNSNTPIQTKNMPNYYAPLNIRFTHDEPVRVQNCKLRIFNRNDINFHASGVTTMVYEARHPNPTENGGELAFRGVNNHSWIEYDATEANPPPDMNFTSSPGMSGLNTSPSDSIAQTTNSYLNWLTKEGATHQSTRHDWYCAVSSTPHSIGSKLYGLYFTLEYL